MAMTSKPTNLEQSSQTDTKPSFAHPTDEQWKAAIEQFKKDNQGKTWDDLANEHEARIKEAATKPL